MPKIGNYKDQFSTGKIDQPHSDQPQPNSDQPKLGAVAAKAGESDIPRRGSKPRMFQKTEDSNKPAKMIPTESRPIY